MASIQCRSLSLAYGPVPVVQKVSFDLPDGGYLVVVGENGSGKSTLFKAMAGLLTPASGSVRFSPEDVRPGYLAQLDDIAANFPASVKEVVLSGSLCRTRSLFYSRQARAQARAALDRMDMLPFADRSFQALSGGQRRRVLLARALVAAQGLLLLDEPTAGLDRATAADLYALLRSLNREEGMTVVTISHDMVAGLDDASHILAMRHGRMAFFGTQADYFAREKRGG